MEGIKVLCFDYYMTLVELDAPFQQIRAWLENYLRREYPDIDSQRFFSKFTRQRAKLSAEDKFYLGIQALSESLDRVCHDLGMPCFSERFVPFIETVFSTPKAYEDAHQVLESLKSKYQVGLLTNADNYILKKSLELQGFQFDFAITSEDAKANKPSKYIFEYAINKLRKNKEEVLMIGDTPMDDIYGAGCLGIRTVWVNRSGENLKEGIPPPVFMVNRLGDIPPKLL